MSRLLLLALVASLGACADRPEVAPPDPGGPAPVEPVTFDTPAQSPAADSARSGGPLEPGGVLQPRGGLAPAPTLQPPVSRPP